MVKYFKSVLCEQLALDIDRFGNNNPELEIVAISHANVVKTSLGGVNDWTAIVVYKRK